MPETRGKVHLFLCFRIIIRFKRLLLLQSYIRSGLHTLDKTTSVFEATTTSSRPYFMASNFCHVIEHHLAMNYRSSDFCSNRLKYIIFLKRRILHVNFRFHGFVCLFLRHVPRFIIQKFYLS